MDNVEEANQVKGNNVRMQERDLTYKLTVPLPASTSLDMQAKTRMSLRVDGMLRAPKFKDHGGGIKKGRLRREPEGAWDRVTIKYGANAKSRTSIGHQIEDILTGVKSMKAKGFEETGLSAKVIERERTPTLTHPFFLARTQPIGGLAIDTESFTTKIPAAEPSSTSSPSGSSRKKVANRSGNVTETWVNLGCNFSSFNTFDFPGSMLPLWPRRDMMHCRGLEYSTSCDKQRPSSRHRFLRKKLKPPAMRLLKEEEVLHPLEQLVNQRRLDMQTFAPPTQRESFCKPQRRILTRQQLRDVIYPTRFTPQSSTQRLGIILPSGNSATPSDPNLDTMESHKGVSNLYKKVATSSGAFQRLVCENQDWVHKYAPDKAERVLLPSEDLFLLRDWVQRLTIQSVEKRTKKSRDTCKSFKAKIKKKRKRKVRMDQFLISNDDNIEDITDPDDNTSTTTSLDGMITGTANGNRLKKLTSSNAPNMRSVIVSGPHGCGKTAAVYAVAHELDFEVFEVNAGTRRSGRDILDNVGNMTKNHLVRSSGGIKSKQALKDTDIPTGSNESEDRQQTITQRVLKGALKQETSNKASLQAAKLANDQTNPLDETGTIQQKQSLILLEEVDVLFEEDKHFWSTVVGLIFESKRPIIMTCTDESRLPIDELTFTAVLRLDLPPENLAIDYLLLLAANEGHLLSRDAVTALFASRQGDLRAAITDLNFWCQRALGDPRSGLEWMLYHEKQEYNNGDPESTRVVSKDAYLSDTGILDNGTIHDASINNKPLLLSSASLLGYYDLHWNRIRQSSVDTSAFSNSISSEPVVQPLRSLELFYDVTSAVDVLLAAAGYAAMTTQLDILEPELTDRTRNNYVEGTSLLQDDIVQDQTGTSEDIERAIRAYSRDLISANLQHSLKTADQNSTISHMIDGLSCPKVPLKIKKATILSAFQPLSEPKDSFLQPKGSQITVFDGLWSCIAEDAGPYIRAIVSSDVFLEEQRLRLSNMLSQGGGIGKKQRTTRSSRAALEGGSKAQTRKDRWFPKGLSFESVLRTGGSDWQDLTRQISRTNKAGSVDRCERSSPMASSSGGTC